MAEGASPLRQPADGVTTAAICQLSSRPAEAETEVQKYEAAKILCALAENSEMPSENSQGDWSVPSLRPQAAKRALAAAAEYQKHAQWLEGERRRLESELNACLQKLHQSQSWMEKMQQQQEEQNQMRQQLQAEVSTLSARLNDAAASANASASAANTAVQHTPQRQASGTVASSHTPPRSSDFSITPEGGRPGSKARQAGNSNLETREVLEVQLNEECAALGSRYKMDLMRIRTELHNRYLAKKAELERAAAVYYERKVLQDLQVIKAQVYKRKLQEFKNAVSMPPPVPAMPPSHGHPHTPSHPNPHAPQHTPSHGGPSHGVPQHALPNHTQHSQQHSPQLPGPSHGVPHSSPQLQSHPSRAPAVMHSGAAGMHAMAAPAPGGANPMVVVGMPALPSPPMGWDPSYKRWRGPEGTVLPAQPQH